MHLSSPSVFARLPLEIIPNILRHAASDAIHERRAWAVDIALINHDAYRAVKHVLYYTMVITSRNHCRVHALYIDDAHRHLLRAVRRLSVPENIFQSLDTGILQSGEQGMARVWDAARFLDAFSDTLEFDIPLMLMLCLKQQPPLKTLYSNVMGVRAGVGLGTMTHLSVYLLGILEPTWVDEAIKELLLHAPTLTHFAINARRSRFVRFEEVEPMLRLAVDSKRLVFIGVALNSREYTSKQRGIFEQHVHQLNDGRLHLWFDERPALLIQDRMRIQRDEAWSGHDVWTEAKPV